MDTLDNKYGMKYGAARWKKKRPHIPFLKVLSNTEQMLVSSVHQTCIFYLTMPYAVYVYVSPL